MITFDYVAKKGTAETVKGKINAQTQEEAVDLINQLGFLPVSVVPEKKKHRQNRQLKNGKVSSKELYTFSRQLANLLKSGVSIIKSLGIIEEQTQNVYFKEVIAEILMSVKNGKTFSESLAKYPKIFSPLYLTLVSAGEEGGSIQQMLLNIASYQKKQNEIIGKVKTATAYPLFMMTLGFLTVYFVLTYILPKMQGLFDNLGTDLPLPTVFLLSISHYLSAYWYLFLAGALIICVVLRQWKNSQKGKASFSRMALHMPLIGGVLLKTELARFSRTIVLMHRGGVSFLRALEISIPILSNELIKRDLMICKDDLTSGGSFGQGIKKSKEIPAIMGHLISVGEESGNIDEVLEEIADTYELEANEQIKVMTTLLEPVMILSVGLIVGFIVFAMLLPIFQIDILAQ